MHKSVKTLVVGAALAAALVGAQTLVAHEGSEGMMGQSGGMMSQGGGMMSQGGGMMSQGGGMKEMMGMMAQMSQMMDTCNKMMQEHHGESQKPAAAGKDKMQ